MTDQIPAEAVEAAAKAWPRAYQDAVIRAPKGKHGISAEEARKCVMAAMTAALSAALPHLRPEPSEDERVSAEVLDEYRRVQQWLERQAALLGPVGDTMHGLAAEALARLIEREHSRHRIPLYGMLDIWQALYRTSHPEFDEFYAEHGYAETWARLCAEVRTRRPAPSRDRLLSALWDATGIPGVSWEDAHAEDRYPVEVSADAVLALFEGAEG